ncbi:hypothetical protein EYC80_000632 [Monilinia laxa]|uniref:Copper transporter n=1 Tax=Monilinia laxa TaxID=61186 RepID=A0A5N6KBF7_MONLA|nr:hypothetical protein EYC80_000632 [Monilinia laxa]
MLLGIFIGCLILRKWAMRAVHDNNTRNFESPGHYNSSMRSHSANPQTSSESAILSLTQGKEIDLPQLRGIEFAICCFVVFVIASGFRFAGYLMARWDVGVGCDELEMIDEYSEEELEQEWRWSDESFGKLTSGDGASDEKGDEELWGGSQALTDAENMV